MLLPELFLKQRLLKNRRRCANKSLAANDKTIMGSGRYKPAHCGAGQNYLRRRALVGLPLLLAAIRAGRDVVYPDDDPTDTLIRIALAVATLEGHPTRRVQTRGVCKSPPRDSAPEVARPQSRSGKNFKSRGITCDSLNSTSIRRCLMWKPEHRATADRRGLRYEITKVGDVMVRTALFEAATVMLTRSTKKWQMKSWALDVVKRRGIKRAIVALARKLGVVLHRMWVDLTEFRFAKEEAAVPALITAK